MTPTRSKAKETRRTVNTPTGVPGTDDDNGNGGCGETGGVFHRNLCSCHRNDKPLNGGKNGRDANPNDNAALNVIDDYSHSLGQWQCYCCWSFWVWG